MGIAIGGGGMANCPIGLMQWLFMSWPPFLLTALSGTSLIWVSWVYPVPRLGRGSRFVLICWAALAACSLIGLVRTTEWDYALLFSTYLIGVACLVLSAAWICAFDRGFRDWLVVAIATATLLCCLGGWQQRFRGLEETRRFAEAQARARGVPVLSAVAGRLEQRRVFGTFVNPNSYAAHLILTGPLMLLALWRWGRRFEPARISQPAFLALGCLAFFGALWFSGSRGALVGFGGGLAVGVLGIPRFRRWRLPLMFTVVILGGAGVALLSRDRALLSVSARSDYYAAAWRMFLGQPFFGVGLGEFFPYYLRLKPIGAEETRIAHNMLLSLLSQAGLAGGLAAALCLAMPVGLVVLTPRAQRHPDALLFSACVAGSASWCIHALVDFNVQIPGTTAIAALVPFLCFAPDEPAVELSARSRRLLIVVARTCGAVAAALFLRLPGERAFQQLSDRADRSTARQVERDAERAGRLLPTSPHPWWWYAKFRERQGRHGQAIRAIRQAIRRSPHRASYYAALARNSLRLDRWREAEKALENAVEWYPGNGSVQALRALVTRIRQGADGTPTERFLLIESVLSRRARMRRERGAIVVTLQERGEPRHDLLVLSETCRRLGEARLRFEPTGEEIRFASADELAQ